jgi:two-component system response regulator PhoP
VKPFHSEELLARVRALVRRSGGWSQSLLSCGPITLATAAEYRVLEYLMLHAGDVVSKSQLTEHLYPDDADRDSNVIEVFIRRLRTKLDPRNSLHPIETLRGRGYRLTLPRRA